ncbi:MAG: hypothetical protein NTX59_02530 [Elusimicrobia bacterium]|nr:hypothetical protein [Elusimicrobiota bacterium]
MLWDVNSNREITTIPHQQDYDVWISRLSGEQIQSIKQEILRKIAGDEIATAGWIPGTNWVGTPFQAIYETACRSNREASGKCFGLFVWIILMEREDYWGFGKYSKNDIPIESMTYFKVHPQL